MVGFMGLQTAKSMGYIDVDWQKIRDDAIKPLDTVSINECIVIVAICSSRRGQSRRMRHLSPNIVVSMRTYLSSTFFFTNFGRRRLLDESIF